MDLGVVAKELCLCAIGCAVIGRLIPRGNLKKYGTSILGVFLLLILFLPVGRIIKQNINVPELQQNPEEKRIDTENLIADTVKKQTEKSLEDALNKAGITFDYVAVDCHIDEDGVINIDHVHISTDEVKRAEKLLAQESGIGEELCDFNRS